MSAPAKIEAASGGERNPGAPEKGVIRGGGRARRAPTQTDIDDLDLNFPDDPEGSGPRSSDDADSALASDDAWDPEDDSDLGLGDDDSDTGTEEVGLDTSTGLEDTRIEDSQEDFGLDDSEENVSWTSDGETDDSDPDDLHGSDAELMSGEEEGWIDDDEPVVDDEAFDPELSDDAPALLDDGGVEGLDDDSELDDLDLSSLPEIDADAEEGSEALAGDALSIDGLDDMNGVLLTDEPTLELTDGVRWKRLPEAALRVTETALPTGAEQVTSLAVDDDPARNLIALGSADALFISHDDGATFVRHPAAIAPAGVAITRTETGLVLWAQNARGQLVASTDTGASFNTVALHEAPAWITSDAGRLSVLCRGQRTRLLQSNDQGAKFRVAVLPELLDMRPTAFGVCGSALLLVAAQTVCFAARGKTLAQLVEGARAEGPAILLDEDDESFAYACVPLGDDTLLVRVALRAGAAREPLVVAALARATFGTPRALAATYSEGFVTLQVATERAIVRVEASLDGETLA